MINPLPDPAPHVFGYGSLVNARTLAGGTARPAILDGWRRAWCLTSLRPHSFLTVQRCPGARVEGVVAPVLLGDWPALDLREAAYGRHPVMPHGDAAMHGDVQVYAVRPDLSQGAEGRGGILLSYLDVVVQGYAQVFGAAGVARFFAETDRWDQPILNDRAAPRYVRHQRLSPGETALVDRHLAALSAVVEELEEP